MTSKEYISPEILILEIVSEGILCDSGMSGYAGDSEDSEF